MSYRITDVSFDLETLGIEPGCVITQIGAAAFNAEWGWNSRPHELFNMFIDPQSCLDLGCTVRWSTIAWWLQQPEAARMAMITPTTRSLSEALTELSSWFASLGDPKDIKVWGHGATFDISLLEDAYRRCKMNQPWHYRNVRDLRTLRALAPDDLVLEAPDSQAGTVQHVAVDDAIAQAKWIGQCMAAIRQSRATAT